jgi:hypothetical protein
MERSILNRQTSVNCCVEMKQSHYRDEHFVSDDWVNHVYTKVRRLYNKLKIGEKTEIA